MILTEYDGHVEQSDGLKSRHYQIATNRKSFEVLSKSLYSDRIGAVIRELSTNAADAHIDAEMRGSWDARPIVVHLPNTMEPFFSVEDFGTGMTDAEIDELYTTYFGSNRNTSNRFTGALGLGSKSPFTYGDQFTVISTVGGKRRIYTCYVTDKGLPDVSPMPIGKDDDDKPVYIEEVNAPNGVLVKVPVELKDICEFETKAADILRWFNPRPDIVGSANYKWIDEPYIVKNDLFGMPKVRRGRSYVIMGNVAYQISEYDIQGLITHERAIIQWGVDIWMDIGEVEIAANREKLTYTPETVKTIKSKFSKIAHQLRDEAIKFMGSAATIWAARRILFEYKQGVMSNFLAGNKMNWNGQIISTCVYFNRYSKSPIQCEVVYKCSTPKNRNYPNLRKGIADHVEADGAAIFVDDCHHGQKKIAYHMAAKSISKCYILSSNRCLVKSKTKVEVDNGDDDDDVNGNPPIEDSGLYETAVLASTLPDVPKLPRNPNNVNRSNYTRLMLYKPCKSSCLSDYWTNAKVDINDGGIYVVMNRFKIVIGGQKDQPKISRYDRVTSHPSNCADAMRLLNVIDGEELEIYGIRVAEAEKLKNIVGWQTFRNYVEEFLAKNSDDFLPRVTRALQFAKIDVCRGFLKLKRNEFNDDSPFGKFRDALFEAMRDTDSKEVVAYVALCDWAYKPVASQIKAAEIAKLDKAYGKLQEVYPLLKIISPGSIDGKTIGHLTEYIQLLDDNRKAGAFKEIFDAKEATT